MFSLSRSCFRVFTSSLFLLLAFLPSAAQQNAVMQALRRPQVMDSQRKLPLSFEANQGQTDQRVKFLSRGSGYTLFLTEDSAVLALRAKDKMHAKNAVLRMKLLGANVHPSVAGTDGLPGKSNYFVGNDPKQWRTNVPTYAAVKYAGVYRGIDLVYHGNRRRLEYDFELSPGADPRAIDLRFEGAQKLTVNRDGALVIKLGGDEVIEEAPVVYQEIGGARKTLAGKYVLRGKGRVGFSVAEYDKSRTLVIDPTLVYFTYLGGLTSEDHGLGIAVDASGNAYVTGWTSSTDFPTTPGVFQTAYNGNVTLDFSGGDAFVSKLNASGLVYSTYLGGNESDFGFGIAVDASGCAYVTGGTHGNFPITPGAFQTTLRGSANAFVTKLNANGSALIYSTYLGGSLFDQAVGIAVDGFDNAYVVGDAGSTDFPTTPGAFQTTFPGTFGTQHVFVSKLNPGGSALVYSTYLGGSGIDGGFAIALDASGNAYVTGKRAATTDFPSTPGAYDSNGDLFVTKLNSAGSALIYSAFLGGGGFDQSQGIAVDTAGNAYITGTTLASNFPTTPGAFQTTYQGNGTPNASLGDAFVSKLNAAGSALVYSTYLGGKSEDGGMGIAVDGSGHAYVTGITYSANTSDFPTTPDTLQTACCAFVSELNLAGSALVFSTYLGGSGTPAGAGIAIDPWGNAYVTGDVGYNGLTQGDAFVSKLTSGPPSAPPVTSGGPDRFPDNYPWYTSAVTVTLSVVDPYSPVSATYYSLDGGPYQGYGGTFSISSDGVHRFVFYSVDTAGRQESPHGELIKIDSTPPVSHVAALPATEASPNFSVQWSGTDATSGLRYYTIYMSDNSGPFTPWLSQTTATQAWLAGFLGHTYKFYSEATDVAGNVEVKTTPDAFTTVPAQMAADVNGDGQINCADIALVKAAFGTKTGQPGFNPSADVNHDGVVNILDLAMVSQKLIPGTTCP